MNETASGTVPQNAQQPTNYVNPRNMTLERQGADTVPLSYRFPRVIGGVCEWCGVIDKHTPGNLQYKLCPHYRGMELRCIYCPQERDQGEVVRMGSLNVASHPYNPKTLVVWCGNAECSKKHIDRFKISA